MSSILPDAAPTNWVDRHAPIALRPWLKLGRFDRPTGIWLLMLPGWQGIALADAMVGRWPDPRLLALFFAGAVLMRSAGCAYNDIVDRDLDAQVARTAGRPVASGEIGVGAAWAFVIACSLVSLLILLSLNGWSVVLGLASLVLVAIYPFMKRITWWPQAWLGLTFNWGAILGSAAANGGFSVIGVMVYGWGILFDPNWRGSAFAPLMGGGVTAAALLLYAAGVFWTLGYDTVYAVQDLEDDALAGVKSSARRLGGSAPRAVAVFYAISLALVLGAWRVGGLGWPSLPLLALAGAQLAWQARRLKLDDRAGTLRLFRSNTLTGVLVFAAMAAGAWRP